MTDWMGNRQKGSVSGGENKVKLIAVSKQPKVDKQAQSGSENKKNEKLPVKSDGSQIRHAQHAHINLGMSPNSSLVSSASDSAENKTVLESNSEVDSNEALIKQIIESEELNQHKSEENKQVVAVNADLDEKKLLNFKDRNEDPREEEKCKLATTSEDCHVLNDAVRHGSRTHLLKQSAVNGKEEAFEADKPKEEAHLDTPVKTEVHISTGKHFVNMTDQCPKNNALKIDARHIFPSDNEKLRLKTAELDTLEKLEHLIEKLNTEQFNLTEPLANISKIVRGQSGENEYPELCIATLIKQGFTQKFEQYLAVNSIHTISELGKGGQGKKFWPTVKRFLMLIWIACDQSVNFCQHILTSDLFQIMQKDLKRLCFQKYTDSELETFTVKSVLGILHNICRHVPNGKWKLRNDGVVSVVRLYLESEVPMIKLKSFIILSYIISEAENEMVNSDDDNFVFIFKVLGDALQSESHKSSKYGMSVVEVMKGLNNLAINDENKIRIVRNGGLPLFQDILESGGPDEIKVTITTLWSLAFHHYNKVKMREMPAIMSKLYEFQHCRDEEICHAARGTFWELENISKSSIGSSVSSSLSADKDPSQPHIMISYQWDSQAVMMKVKDRLRHAGYKVWMDIEHMTGSTLEAMALAVEKAAVVLICMSQKYKDSPNCRTEAEYVYRLRKDFVPLRLQKEYIPDGWLGILVGTRLYFDIYSEDQLDVQVPRLTRELRDRGKITPSVDQPDRLPIVPQRMTSREAVPILHHPASPTVSNWTALDVKRWITSLGLNDFAQNFEEIDGLLLLELQNIQGTAPEYFHSILRKDFDIPVAQALKLSRCLRQLS